MATKTEEKAPTIDKVHAEPGRLLAEEQRWSERRAEIVGAIAAAEATAGARVLDGGDAALRSQADGLASQKAEIAGSDAAVQEARRRRVLAIGAFWLADAISLRRQAQTLREEATERQKTTDGLLGQLRDHEGCEYRPVPSLETQVAALGMGSPVQLAAMGFTGQPNNVPPARTDALRAEAANLEAQADALLRRVVQDSGGIAGATREALLDQVRAVDPMVIGPRLAAVEDWLDGAEPPVLELLRIRLARGQGGALSYEVVWQRGELDRGRCHVALQEHSGRRELRDAPVQGA